MFTVYGASCAPYFWQVRRSYGLSFERYSTFPVSASRRLVSLTRRRACQVVALKTLCVLLIMFSQTVLDIT